jgi:hypothetical protein
MSLERIMFFFDHNYKGADRFYLFITTEKHRLNRKQVLVNLFLLLRDIFLR